MYTLLLGGALLTSCSDDDEAPEPENVVEVFTHVTLIFTNTADPSNMVMARAVDPDGDGVEELQSRMRLHLPQGLPIRFTMKYSTDWILTTRRILAQKLRRKMMNTSFSSASQTMPSRTQLEMGI